MTTPPRKLRVAHLFGWIVFIGLAVMLFVLLQTPARNRPNVALSDFESHLLAGQVTDVQIEKDRIIGNFDSPYVLSNNTTAQNFVVELPEGTTSTWQFAQWLIENRHDATVTVDNHSSVLRSIIAPLIPWLLIFGFIWFIVTRLLRAIRPARVVQSQEPLA